MNKFFLFLFIVVLGLFTFRSVFGEVCGDSPLYGSNCRLVTPSLSCSSYDLFDENATQLVSNGNLSLFSNSSYFFDLPSSSGSFFVRLCDNSSRSITYQPMFNGSLCTDLVSQGLSCKLVSPVMGCSGFSLYNSSLGLVQSGNLSVFNNDNFYFNFSEPLGTYLVSLCDGSTRELTVANQSQIILNIIQNTYNSITNTGGGGGYINNYFGAVNYSLRVDFRDKSTIKPERLLFNVFYSVDGKNVKPNFASARVFGSDGKVYDEVFLKNPDVGVYVFDYDFKGYVNGDYFVKFDFDQVSRIVSFSVSDKSFLDSVYSFFVDSNGDFVVWKIVSSVVIGGVILGLLIFIVLSLGRKKRR